MAGGGASPPSIWQEVGWHRRQNCLKKNDSRPFFGSISVMTSVLKVVTIKDSLHKNHSLLRAFCGVNINHNVHVPDGFYGCHII